MLNLSNSCLYFTGSASIKVKKVAFNNLCKFALILEALIVALVCLMKI